MVDINLAHEANEVLKRRNFDRKYHVSANFIHESQIFDSVKGRVIYIGCGIELSSLFLFENADMYIHQDLTDPNLPLALECFANNKIISDLDIHSNGDFRRESSFRYKNMPKKLIEIHGGDEFRDVFGSNGDIAFNVPDEVREELSAIYFFGMPYPESIRCLQINLLPHLKMGGLFEGPYPYAGGEFEGAPPSELGLSYSEGTYIKTRHLTGEDVQRTIRYSIDDYIDHLMLSGEMRNRVNIHPKMMSNLTKCLFLN